VKNIIVLSAVFLSSVADAKTNAPIEDPKVLAEKYLVALADGHDQSGKDHLLGGLTLDAVTATTLMPEIVGQAPKRSEDGSLAELSEAIDALDKAGIGGLKDGQKDLSEIGIADAKKLMGQTKLQRQALAKKFPVIADVIRYDRPVYWHPRNPTRVLLKESAKTGTYHLDYVAFTVSSHDSSGKAVRWPLRIVRFKIAGGDTGWKVLPASEWDPE
jgi:hypothetical protein